MVFTTHTPVPAGNQRFPFSLVKKYLSRYVSEFGISPDEFLAFGKETPETKDFCQTVLAIKLSSIRNGVSKIHGSTSRSMWKEMWPNVPVDEVPIGHVSNGIHTRSWISNDLAGLYDRYLGPRWILRPSEQDIWDRIDTVPDGELWRTHERRRERLVAFARRRLKTQLERRGAPLSEVALADEVLDPDALTIGFARRFASYKRAALVLRDIERLSLLFNNKEHPGQIIFAGKAHPRDRDGKELIKTIVHYARREDMRRRIVFIEDYDLNVARYLVQGCDVWLNTPLRPEEASGTSGMKAAANGALNLSIPDGWWPEGYSHAPCNGWVIGKGESYPSRDEQDEVESKALYALLEKEVFPSFYERGADGLPRKWITSMKNAIRSIGPYFGTNRMVMEYFEQCYAPAFKRWQELSGDNLAQARELTRWKQDVKANWPSVKVAKIEMSCEREILVGDPLEVHAFLELDGIKPEDVRVELLAGPIDVNGNLGIRTILPLTYRGACEDKLCLFGERLDFKMSGQQGFALRVLPDHKYLANRFDTGLILWADAATLVCTLNQPEKK
jgi:starch phosphorylase